VIPSDELTGTDQVQARLEGMRAEFRAAQLRRYEKVAITAANNTEIAPPASQTKPLPLATPSSR
jgi:hypothetical protein